MPEAVPVAITTWEPSWARSAAARWWDQREVTPAPAHAAYTLGSTQVGQGTSAAARAGTSWTCCSRSLLAPLARVVSAVTGSNARRRGAAEPGGVEPEVDIAATVIPRADGPHRLLTGVGQ
ncbi:hypothetical protein GCM10009845_21710 [Pedococcus bigeumensis]